MIPTIIIIIMILLWIGSCVAILYFLGHEITELIKDLEELEIELSNLEQENLQLKTQLNQNHV